MRSLLLLCLLPFLGCSASPSSPPLANPPVASVISAKAPALKWSVLASFPHDTGAFTEGLLWHEGKLYESTGEFGQSSLRRVDLQSGQVEKKIDLPQNLFGEGLAFAGGRFYQLTWQNKLGFVYDESFKPLAKFSYTNEGWGLTFDGKSLIQSDGSDTLTWRDPKDFKAQNQVKVTWDGQPVTQLNELEWIDGKVWANVWQTNTIVVINPRNGKVESYLDLSGLIPAEAQRNPDAVLNGIAYDPQNKRVFITGKDWPKLFWLQVNPSP